MKAKKKLAAMLLSLVMVFSLVPISAMADTSTAAPITTPAVSAPLIAADKVSTTTGSLTISKDGSASTFAIYQLYSMTPSATTKLYTYTKNSAFSALPDNYNDLAKNYTTPEQLAGLTKSLRTAISSNSTSLVVKGSTKLGDQLDPFVAQQTASLDSGNTYKTTFNNLALGYYLVIETATTGSKTASKDFLVSVPLVQNGAWVYTVTATCKDSTVTTDKTITGSLTDVTTKDLTGATRNINDTVPYRLDADVPQYDLNTVSNITFALNDTMSKGLTYNTSGGSNGVTVYGFNKGITTATSANDITSHFNVAATSDANGTTLTITCKSDADFKALVNSGYTSISAFYSATLNSSAVIGSLGNPNTSYLIYTTSPGVTTNSEKHHAIVYTFGLQILKLGTTDSHPALKGAEFTLYSNSDLAASHQLGLPQVSGDNGTLNFTGLKDGTYFVKETKAPDGYSLLDGYITVQIIATLDSNNQPTGDFTWQYKLYNAANWTTSTNYTYSDAPTNTIKVFGLLTVYDDKGFTLPGTGGIGTTIFFVSGIAILLLGGCMALVYTKKRKKTGGHFQH